MKFLILQIRDERDMRSLYHCLRAQKKDQSLKKLWLYAQVANEMKTKGGFVRLFDLIRYVLVNFFSYVEMGLP